MGQQKSWWPLALFLLIALVYLEAPAVFGAQSGAATSAFDPVDSSRIRWGDSPRDDQGRFLWFGDELDSPLWLDPATAEAQRPDDHGDYMWTRFVIPEGDWIHPVLYLPMVLVAFEVYLDDALIYRRGDFEPSHDHKYTSVVSYLIPLPENAGGSVVSCRIYSPYRKFIGIQTDNQEVLVGQQLDIFRHLFLSSIDSLILGSLYFFAGLISLVIFLRRLRLRIWYLLSFAWLTCNIGVFYIINDAVSGQLGIPTPVAYYLGSIAFVAFPVGIYTFLELITGKHRVLRWLWRLQLLYLLVAVPLDLFNIVLLATSGVFYSIAFAVGIAICLVIVVQAMARGRREARIFGIGFIVFALTGLHDLLAGLGVIPLGHWLSQWGMLVLILHLAYILEQIYSDTLRKLRESARELSIKSAKLEEYSATLEQRVADRTRDLAEKNEHLVDTMQQLKEAQAQMLVQDKMASLGNLVAGVAHEINTPLGAVIGAVDVESRCIDIVAAEIDRSTDLEELRASSRFQRARRSLAKSNEVLKTGSNRIMAIMGSLRSFARLDEAAVQEVDLHDGLESSLTLLEHQLKNRIEVVRDYGDLPRIACHANQINQVFMNILVNAAQAIEGSGTITIKTMADEEEVEVRVTDTGPGISAADQKHIFDPGFTTKGVGVGTGLGLAICYKIIAGHRGRITVDSETGRGTTMAIRLPIAKGLTPGEI